MIRIGQGDQERKLLLNSVADDRALWPVVLPEAIKVGTTPTITFTLADGSTQSPALTVVRESDAVDGIGGGATNDRKRLTKSGGGLSALQRGIPGVDFGQAHLITKYDGNFAIQVKRIDTDADTIVLADNLSSEAVVSALAPATVQWSTWTCIIPVQVTAAETFERPIPWVVRYTAKAGEDAPDMPSMAIHGFVHVVRRMFQTGLTHQRFMQLLATMGVGAVHNRLSDWTPIIDMAFMRLVQMIRQDGPSTSRRAEDDLDGGAFFDVHLFLTAALVMLGNAEEYKRLSAEAERLFKIALQRVINAAETQAVAQNMGTKGVDLVGGNFGGTDTSLTGTSRRVTQRIGQGW